MSGVIGLNILGQYVANSPALINLARRLNPAAFLVMDSLALYNALSLALPNATAIYRAYHPLDAEVFIHWTPERWLEEFGHLAPGGYVQVGNEPNGYVNTERQVAWFVELARQARRAGKRLGLCAYGVGHPSETAIMAGAFDPLIRELADGYHILILHEYGKDSTRAERPHHIGRFAYWRDRARAIGVNAPGIVIGEYGRDNVAPGQGGGLHDGWRGVGWSEEQYLEFLRGAADLYAREGIPACIFCYGRGAGDGWQSFNIEGANTLLDGLVTMNSIYKLVTNSMPQPFDPKPADAGAAVTAKLISGLSLNVRQVRSTANNTPVRVIKGGQLLDWYPATDDEIVRSGRRWAWIEGAAGGGWCALVKNSWDEQFVDPDDTLPLPTAFRLQIPIPFPYAITGRFGEPRVYPGYTSPQKHEGIDFAPVNACAPGKLKIVAAADGVVQEVRDWAYLKAQNKFTTGYGMTVILRHEYQGDTYLTWYAHLSAASVCKGDRVGAGDEIGIIGTSGNSTGLHLHFTVQRIGKGLPGFVLADVIDPTPLLGQ